MVRAGLTEKEIICRFDMVEIFIKKTTANRKKWEENRNDLVTELTNLFLKPSKAYRQGNRIRIDFSQDDDLVILSFPTSMIRSNDLGRVRITNKKKWDWAIHNGYVRAVGDILDLLNIEYGVSKAEIAFDIPDRSTAMDFFETVLLKWGRADRLFNYGKGKFKEGGSKNGIDEYMFRRGASRQTHSYERKYKEDYSTGIKRDESFFRWEFKSTRKYLRRKRIETIDNLFNKAQELVENSLAFKRLDRKKINREIKGARNWSLAGKSVHEQHRMLKRNGLNKDQIKKYYKTLSWPEIIFTFDEELLNSSNNNLDFALISNMPNPTHY